MLYTLHKFSKILKWYKNQNNILSFSMEILMFIHWWVRNNLIESKLIMQFLDLGVSALMVWIVGKLLHIFFCDKLLDVDEAEIQCKWLEVSNFVSIYVGDVFDDYFLIILGLELLPSKVVVVVVQIMLGFWVWVWN